MAHLAALGRAGCCQGEGSRQPAGCLGECERVSGAQLQVSGEKKRAWKDLQGKSGKENDDCCPEGEVIVKHVCP